MWTVERTCGVKNQGGPISSHPSVDPNLRRIINTCCSFIVTWEQSTQKDAHKSIYETPLSHR